MAKTRKVINKNLIAVLTLAGMFLFVVCVFILLRVVTNRDPEAFARSAREYFEKGEIDRATQLMGRAYQVSRDPDGSGKPDVKYVVELADMYYRSGEAFQSLGRLRAAYAAKPTRTDVLQTILDRLWELRRFGFPMPKETVEYAEALLKVKEDDADAHAILAMSLDSLVNVESANARRADEELARAKSLDSLSPHVALADLAITSRRHREELLASKDPEKASTLATRFRERIVSVCEPVLQKHPGAVYLVEIYGNELILLGRGEEALQVIDRGLAAVPQSAELRHAKARYYLDLAVKGAADREAQAKAIAACRAAAQDALKIEPGILDLYGVLATVKVMEAPPGIAGQPYFDEALAIVKKGFMDTLTLRSARATIDSYRGERLMMLVRGFGVAGQYPVEPKNSESEKRRVEAMKVFVEEAERRYPQSAQTAFMRGTVYIAERDWTSAVAAFNKANSSADVASLFNLFGRLPTENLALLYRELDQPGESLKWTEKAIEQYRGELRREPALVLILNRAELMNMLGKPQEAIDVLTSAGPEFANDPRIARVKAESLQKLGRADDAMRLLASVQDTTGVGVLVDQGRIALLKGDLAAAEQALRKAFDQAPENEVVLTRLFGVLMRAQKQKEALEWIHEARAKVKAPLLLKLLDSWQITVTETDPKARMAKIKELLEAEPDPFRRATDLYNFHQTLGQLAEARQQLDQAEKLQPDDAQVLEFQLGLAMQDKDRARADAYVTRLAKLNADRAGGGTYRGAVALAFGEYAIAIREYEEADKKLPDTSFIKLKLAQVCAALRQTERAIDLLREAVRINPRDLAVRKSLYGILREKGETEAAKEQLTAALQLDPNDKDMLAQQDLLLEESDPVKGIDVRLKRARIEPENAENHARICELSDKLRTAALQLGNMDRAREAQQLGDEEIEKALGLAPTNLTVVTAARKHYAATYQIEKGVEAIRKFAEGQSDILQQVQAELSLARFYEDARKLDEADKAFDHLQELIREKVTKPEEQRAGILRVLFERISFNARVARDDRAQQIAETALGMLDARKPDEATWIRDAQLQLSRSLLAQRKAVEAQKQLDDILSRNRTDVGALMLRAEMWLQRGNTEKAIADLSAVLETRPDDVIVRFTRGDLYVRMRQYQAGRDDLIRVKTFCDEHPDTDVTAQYRLESRSRLVSLYEIQDVSELAEQELLGMLNILGVTPGTDFARQRTADRLIALLRRSGKLAKAEEICAEYISKFPRVSDWPLKLGALLYERKQYSVAAERFMNAMQVAEKDNLDIYSQAFAMRLRSLVKSARASDAKVVYENRAIKDVRPIVHWAAAEVYAAAGDAAKAAELRKSALLDAIHRSGTPLQRVVLDMSDQLSVDEYVKAWEQILTELSDPVEVARVRYIQARRLATEKRLQEALPLLEPGIALEDKNLVEHSDAMVMQAQILDQLDRTDDAIKAYEVIIAEQPGEVSALNNLAYLLATKKNQPQAALQYSQRAVNLAKNQSPLALIDTHAWILHLNGQNDEAEGRLREALSIDPFYTPALEHLARLLESTQRGRDAIKFYELLRDVAQRDNDAASRQLAEEALKRLQ